MTRTVSIKQTARPAEKKELFKNKGLKGLYRPIRKDMYKRSGTGQAVMLVYESYIFEPT
jgi:hypothetical protein